MKMGCQDERAKQGWKGGRGRVLRGARSTPAWQRERERCKWSQCGEGGCKGRKANITLGER